MHFLPLPGTIQQARQDRQRDILPILISARARAPGLEDVAIPLIPSGNRCHLHGQEVHAASRKIDLEGERATPFVFFDTERPERAPIFDRASKELRQVLQPARQVDSAIQTAEHRQEIQVIKVLRGRANHCQPRAAADEHE